ncbi:hypothetical protein [Paenibacillus sp. NEAU-GSW1]|uniref:hypothetical protein n=1 Tax=Paenibacillus sp. NEAU-GSW1 TaxID=2682486 RepID=UPI0012E1FE69|nr:hypothetical protein [Paenibacillus sp. NEAU-GSW1]MUT67476.1 hypothetical protein [Paenibacillus sp. NEAU-GSW1]
MSAIFLVTLAAVLLFVVEWRQIADRKSKICFTIMSFAVWALLIIVMIEPQMPGPQTLIKTVFEPYLPKLSK